MGPGDFALVDSAHPYGFRFDRPFRSVILQIPRAMLTSRCAVAEHVTAVPFRTARGTGAFVSPVLCALAEQGHDLDETTAVSFMRNLLDLLATACDALDSDVPGKASAAVHRRDLRRPKAYLADRLHDPGRCSPPATTWAFHCLICTSCSARPTPHRAHGSTPSDSTAPARCCRAPDTTLRTSAASPRASGSRTLPTSPGRSSPAPGPAPPPTAGRPYPQGLPARDRQRSDRGARHPPAGSLELRTFTMTAAAVGRSRSPPIGRNDPEPEVLARARGRRGARCARTSAHQAHLAQPDGGGRADRFEPNLGGPGETVCVEREHPGDFLAFRVR